MPADLPYSPALAGECAGQERVGLLQNAAGGHAGSSELEEPRTPNPIGSSMLRGRDTAARSGASNATGAAAFVASTTPICAGAATGVPTAAQSRGHSKGLDSAAHARAEISSPNPKIAKTLLYACQSQFQSRIPRLAGSMQNNQRLMATMPHESLLLHGLDAASDSGGALNEDAHLMQNGRAPFAKPIGTQRYTRRPPKAARPRAAARKAYAAFAASKPVDVPVGVDGGKLHRALQALANAPGITGEAAPSDHGQGQHDGPSTGTAGKAVKSSGTAATGSAGSTGGIRMTAGSRAAAESGADGQIDSGTCEERVGRRPFDRQGATGRGASGTNAMWPSFQGSSRGKAEATEMHQEAMQALYLKQQTLVREAAEVAADLEAQQATASDSPSRTASRRGPGRMGSAMPAPQGQPAAAAAPLRS